MSRVLIFIALFGVAATSKHHGHNRTAFGDITLEEGEEARSVIAIGGSVTLLEGSRAHEVIALGGSVELAKGAQVERDVMAIGGDITVGPEARIGRNASTYGGAIEVDEGGAIAGTISPHPGYDVGDSGDEEQDKGPSALGTIWLVAWGVFELLFLFAFGALVLLVLPRQVDGIIETFTHHPWGSALTGLLATVLLPPLLVMMVVTLVGILFIPGLLVAIGLAGAVGYSALALFIGRRIPIHVGDYGKLALGVVIVTAVSFIPVAGEVAWALGWLVAFGAVLRSRFGTRTGASMPGAPPPAMAAAA
jgi:hypothetical protein